MERRRVFFLGAGATKADFPDAPSLKDLLGKMLSVDAEEYLAEKGIIRNFLSQYFFDLNGKSDSQYPLIQDVLSFIDAGLLNETYFEIDKKYLIEIRDALIYLMGITIEKGMQVQDKTSILKLVGSLLYNPQDVVISTNYDIVVDNCFLKTFQNGMNYGVKFRKGFDTSSGYPDVYLAVPPSIAAHSIDTGASLLKLHGSFNWLYCPRCDELDISVAQKGALECMSSKVYCYNNQSCTELYQPLIISPTFLKNYKNRIIREVWSLAEQAVANAQEIIFIGYSMPVDDYEIKSMLLRGIARNKNKEKPAITVVDKCPKDDIEKQENKQYKMNYEKVFGSIGYMECGFARYVSEL